MDHRTADNAAAICALIAEGFTLRQIAAKLHLSSASRIIEWVQADASFAERYARAKEVQADRMAEEIIEISDDGSNDWVEREGMKVPDHEHMARSRLRVDTRKWLMSKMLAKKYGDKLDLAHSGSLNVTRVNFADDEG